jgi:hypothetical protein
MTLTELLLLRGGWTPAQLGLPDDVYDPAAPRGVPCRGDVGRDGWRSRNHGRVRGSANRMPVIDPGALNLAWATACLQTD